VLSLAKGAELVQDCVIGEPMYISTIARNLCEKISLNVLSLKWQTPAQWRMGWRQSNDHFLCVVILCVVICSLVDHNQ